MGFKANTSFLRFLSMGAAGVHQTMRQLSGLGFEPIELERYCGSNKIWATKVKRLRLPDLLCVRTGLRVEVRAKTDLKIRMSDAPSNPDRVWDAGLRDDDVAAFITCFDAEEGPRPAEEAVFFTIRSLRDSISHSKLGPPKSASEGAERDRTWSATVPSRDGVVLCANAEKLLVKMGGDGQPPRRQTYRLAGKHVYVSPDDRFKAGASILAGAPDRLADLTAYLARPYDPLGDLRAANAVDRYAAVKALRFRQELRHPALPALEGLLEAEPDERVLLEAAGSATALGSSRGQDTLHAVLWGQGRTELRMETVLILTELSNTFAHEELRRIASERRLADNEIRQAAIWGLGKAGLKAYDDLLPFIDDDAENVALHAIAAFGKDTPRTVINALVSSLRSSNSRRMAAASEALRIIGSPDVLDALIQAVQDNQQTEWILATLGRLPAAMVRKRLEGSELLKSIAPILVMSEGENWLSSENMRIDVAFLLNQHF